MNNVENKYDPYCPICSGCGEDGCCQASICKMDVNGSYCQTYLKDLKLGYEMDRWFQNNLYDKLDDKLKEEYDKMWDTTYDLINK